MSDFAVGDVVAIARIPTTNPARFAVINALWANGRCATVVWLHRTLRYDEKAVHTLRPAIMTFAGPRPI